MKRNALVFLILMLLISISAWADQVIIGTGVLTQRQPLGCYWGYERSASIYTSAEIGTTGDISILEWYPTVAQTVTVPVKVYLMTTTASTLTADTWANAIAGATLVYNGNFSNPGTTWFPINLTTPFSYGGGANNLIVLVETNYGGTGVSPSTSSSCAYSTATSQNEYWYADNNPPLTSGAVSATRPNIRITISNPIPMTFTSCTTSQNTTAVWAGDTQQQVIGIQVVMTGSLTPLNLTQFTLKATGTTSVSEISNAKIFYTGANSTFSATSQFGSTVAAPTLANYTVSGTQTLGSGNNYFWLTYDVSASSVSGHVIDAECPSLTIDGVAHVPTITAPTGSRTINVPLTGTKTVGTGMTYTTMTAAINALNTLGVGAGGVIFSLTSGAIFTEDLPVITATGAADRTILFTTSAAGHATIKPTFTSGGGSDAGIAINGGDYITFNGIDVIIVSGGNAVEYGYYLYGGAQHCTIQNTTITLLETNTSTKAIYSYSTATTAATANSYNHFYNITSTHTYNGVYLSGSSTSGAEDTDNEVGISGGTTSIGTIGSSTASTSVYGIYAYYQKNAKIFNLTVITAASTTGSIYGIYTSGSASTIDIYNCQIRALASTSSGYVYGIYVTSGTTANIYSNTLRTLSSAGASVYGIYTYGGTTNNIYKNYVYDVTYSGTGSYSANGIYLAGGSTNNVYNNMIRTINAVASTATPGSAGIYLSSGTTENIYYNSILLSETGTVASTFSAALYASSTPTTIDMRNNSFVNKSTTGTSSTGRAVAFWKSTASYTNIAAVTNNNAYYAGTPSATNPIHYDGTNTYNTLALYKAAIATKDQSSITENVPYISTTNLHLSASTATQLESGGIPITTPIAITGDYDGDTGVDHLRSATTPDIGADEGVFVINDLNPPTISYTALVNTSSASSRTLSAVSIVDPSNVNVTAGTKPRIYFKKKTDANAFGVANNSTGDGWKWTETAGGATPFDLIIDVIKLRSVPVGGDSIQYFVVAQDLATTPNVGAQPGNGFVGTSVAAITTAPTTPNSYLIIPSISGVKTIGSGGVYSTITEALTVLNSAELVGWVEYHFLDSDYSTRETFPLTINAIAGSSVTNTITFKPATGVSTTITGSNSTAIWNLNGAIYVTIDGSNNGTTSKDLTIINNSTTAPTINFAGASASNTIKNCNINGANSSSSSAIVYITTTTAGNSNSILSCDLGSGDTSPAIGVYFTGSFTGGQVVQDCSIRGMTSYGMYVSNSLSNGILLQTNSIRDFGSYGIYLAAGSNVVVNNCEIFGSSTSTLVGGIYLGNNPGAIIKKNKIHDIQGSTSATLVGIYIYGYSGAVMNQQVINNEIYLETGVASTTGSVKGIDYYAFSANSCEIYYNSVFIGGTGVTGSTVSYAFHKRDAATTFKVENNIFVNARSNSTGTAKHYAIGITGGGTTTTTLVLDRNDYLASGTGGVLGVQGTTDASNIAAWRLLSLQDANSIATEPYYNYGSPYLQPYNISPVFGAGTPITGITDDKLDVVRNVTTPAMGAFETGLALVVPNPATPLSPSNGATGQALGVTLYWTNDGGYPSTCLLNFGTNLAANNLMSGVDIGLVTSYSPSSLAGGQTYYWQVVPKNSAGGAVGCPIWHFTTISSVTPPINVSITQSGATAIIGWSPVSGATGYKVYWATSPTAADLDWHFLASPTTNTYTATDLTNDLRFYKVTATQ